jgi:predicted ArsR family transcriptional regulator
VTVVLSSTQRRILIALCRPCRSESGVASPATDEEIAEELVLSVGEVRAHLRVLDAKLGVQERSERAARARLVERAFSAGVISERDL